MSLFSDIHYNPQFANLRRQAEAAANFKKPLDLDKGTLSPTNNITPQEEPQQVATSGVLSAQGAPQQAGTKVDLNAVARNTAKANEFTEAGLVGAGEKNPLISTGEGVNTGVEPTHDPEKDTITMSKKGGAKYGTDAIDANNDTLFDKYGMQLLMGMV